MYLLPTSFSQLCTTDVFASGGCTRNKLFVTVCTCADVDKMYLTIYLSTHFLLICNQC